MNKLNIALWRAKTDIFWFMVMLFAIMMGFVVVAFFAFGAKHGRFKYVSDSFLVSY